MNPTFDDLANQLTGGTPVAPPPPPGDGAIVPVNNQQVQQVSGSGTVQRLPFGFTDVDAAKTGQADGFSGLPVLEGSFVDACGRSQEQRDGEMRREVCCIVMKRVAKWFHDNGCPVIITPYNPNRGCSVR